MQSRTYNAKKNIITGLGGKFISMLFPFLTRTCIIYIFGATYLGLNSLFSSILQVLSLAELGFGEAMVFSMYEPLNSNDTKKVCAILNLYKNIYRIIGLIIFAFGLCVLPFLENLISGGYPDNINVIFLYLINLVNIVVSYLMFAYKSSLLSAMQRISVCNSVGMIMQIAMSLTQLVLLLLFKNYYLYAIVIPIFTILRNLVVHFESKKICPQYVAEGKLERSEILSIGKRVAGLFIYKLCSTLRNSFDSIVISAFLGLVILGKYENYYFILTTIIGFFTIISTSITAGVGNSIVAETIEKNYKDFLTFFFIYEWLTCFCTVCLFCLYQPFILLWLGEDYMFEMGVVVLLCMYFYILKTGDICYVYRQAVGIWWSDKFRPAIEAGANLILNLIFVKRFGVAGVLLATVTTMLAFNLFWSATVLFRTYFKRTMKQYLGRMLFYAVITFICILVTYKVCAFFPNANLLAFIGKMVVCTILPNLIMLIAYFRLPEFSMMKVICKRIIAKSD